jgi:quercetin dioxygenase-like cupin family protein
MIPGPDSGWVVVNDIFRTPASPTMRIQRPFFASPIVWAAGAAVVGIFAPLQANEPHKHNAFSEPGKAAFQTAIANVKGKTMTGIIVDFKPGAVVPPHRHGNALVVAYVQLGSVRSKVDEGEVKIFHEGESWTEAPGAHHALAENASKTEPAKVFVIFVVDDEQKEFHIFDKKQ